MKYQNSWTKNAGAAVVRQPGNSTRACLLLLAMSVVIVSGADAETFRKAKMIDPKGREQSVDLGFDAGKQLLTVKAAGEHIYQVSYGEIEKMSYEVASRHRIKEGAVVMIFSLGAGAAVMFTKSKSHWFYVDYQPPAGDVRTLTLKLDRGEYKKVLAVAASQTGKTVETLAARGFQKR